MKRFFLFFIGCLLILNGMLFSDSIRTAANYVEYVLSGEVAKALERTSNDNLTEEKLIDIRLKIFNEYGLLNSYLKTDITDKDKVILYALMERGLLKFDVMLDALYRVLSFEYEAVSEIPVSKSRITIKTEPEHSSVYFNDIFQGWAPLELIKNTGKCKISIYKNGFEEKIQYLQLSEGDDLLLNITLRPKRLLSEMDFKIGNSVLLNSFDRGGWFPADWISETIKLVEPVPLHQTQGEKALKVEFETSEPGEVVIQYPFSIEPRNLEKTDLFFLDVFWESEEDGLLSIALQNGKDWTWYETDSFLLKRGNNFSVPLNLIVGNEMGEVKVLNIKFFLPAEQTTGTVYFDNLRVYQSSE
ncbi:MAG TPA: PEGA domain-containing protein [Thermotogota bacterium]|nr:PEGA domain-containing protein [Thermotogota bacterium]HPJ89660.1 PEGA domain-containing protein [Thermotogota bacterium]HPR96835.1 PEGA domain-containing protein [Thermotogota bacterium]